jgi:hypothetical protein
MSVGPHFNSFITLRCDKTIKIDFDRIITPFKCHKTIKMRPNGHFVFSPIVKYKMRQENFNQKGVTFCIFVMLLILYITLTHQKLLIGTFFGYFGGSGVVNRHFLNN